MTWAERDKLILANLTYGKHYYKVYIHLRDEGTLTTQESISLWGRYNLAQVVARLKKYGATIVDLNIGESKGRYRSKRLKPWARYKLVQEDDNEPLPEQ